MSSERLWGASDCSKPLGVSVWHCRAEFLYSAAQCHRNERCTALPSDVVATRSALDSSRGCYCTAFVADCPNTH